jgi:hypothetical protein
VEMLDVNFYAAFEEAVNEYSAQVNQMNIQNYLLTFQGQKVADVGNLTGKAVISTPLPYIIELAKSSVEKWVLVVILIGRRDSSPQIHINKSMTFKLYGATK